VFHKTIPIILSAFTLLSCQTTTEIPPLPEPRKAQTISYIIGPEDVLQIHVWKHPNLSVTVPVRSDGKISMPLINDILAAGLSPQNLTDNIAERLKKYIENPTVSVILESINSLKISVSGNVNAPGVYKIGPEISLVDALSLAGGLRDFADSENIRIIRKVNGTDKIYRVNYDLILSGEDINQNIILYPSDSVIVP
jgi:polysaccharide export outer membrane protein